MKKKDLRTGMAVRLRNNGWYYILLNTDTNGANSKEKSILVQKMGDSMGWMPLGRYDEDMRYHSERNDFVPHCYSNDREWDIMEVRNCGYCVDLFNSGRYETIWERGDALQE